MLVTDENGKVIVDTLGIATAEKVSLDGETYSKSPYHLVEIKKGVIGELSKIREELDELEDAERQGIKIMIMIELSDLYGAIEFFTEKQGLTMEDLKKFSDLNKRVKSIAV